MRFTIKEGEGVKLIPKGDPDDIQIIITKRNTSIDELRLAVVGIIGTILGAVLAKLIG